MILNFQEICRLIRLVSWEDLIASIAIINLLGVFAWINVNCWFLINHFWILLQIVMGWNHYFFRWPRQINLTLYLLQYCVPNGIINVHRLRPKLIVQGLILIQVFHQRLARNLEDHALLWSARELQWILPIVDYVLQSHHLALADDLQDLLPFFLK